MSYFELDHNELDLILIRYSNYYMKELTYYGTSNSDQMLMLIGLSQELNIIEKNIFNNYYNKYVKIIIDDIENENIYYLQKILFELTNIILKMINLFIKNKVNTEEYHYKSRYLIGFLENYINKIIDPIELKLDEIFNMNKVFKINYSLVNLKKFINIYKDKFTSEDILVKFNRVINLFENN